MKNSVKAPKIINDPVHGFIEIPRGLILNLIDSPTFQRLRRIKQLGQSSLVYPGAVHTRFNHAMGAMHLMRQALDVLKRKKVEITKQEYKAAQVAILLHDVGHGPFSHALEHVIIPNLHHEDMSLALMHNLNKHFRGKLDLAIEIFEGKYPRPFFHQLVSGQLDMDRMDYLIRDSFFTGVAEGIVGIDRIIKILNVHDGNLVCEDKGIYSLEKFVLARRLMYWQVYLHKAAMAAEYMIVNILRRVRMLVEAGEKIYLDENLGFFFKNNISPKDLTKKVLNKFIQLDDNDIEFAIKKWQSEKDPVLSDLCQRIQSRKLLKIRMSDKPYDEKRILMEREKYAKAKNISMDDAAFYIFSGTVSNQPYVENSQEPIVIRFKNGELKDLSEATDLPNIHALATPVVKYYYCSPAEMQEEDKE
ncbi:MAG: HD domain-containing protein [Bacteroidia bacterium]|nr:HD domain-containing protein [Bacteroidia bacterium]